MEKENTKRFIEDMNQQIALKQVLRRWRSGHALHITVGRYDEKVELYAHIDDETAPLVEEYLEKELAKVKRRIVEECYAITNEAEEEAREAERQEKADERNPYIE